MKDKQVAEKKAKLLEMARNGQPKPSKVLRTAAYDPEFAEEIRRVAPQWFTP
jgi:hypothetical protein